MFNFKILSAFCLNNQQLNSNMTEGWIDLHPFIISSVLWRLMLKLTIDELLELKLYPKVVFNKALQFCRTWNSFQGKADHQVWEPKEPIWYKLWDLVYLVSIYSLWPYQGFNTLTQLEQDTTNFLHNFWIEIISRCYAQLN